MQHNSPTLPIRPNPSENGLGIVPQIRDFAKFRKSCIGYAVLIPPILLQNEDSENLLQSNKRRLTSSQCASRRQQALRNCVSIIKLSEQEQFVVWGPLALLNHDCKAPLRLCAPSDLGTAPRQGKIYRWELERRSNTTRNFLVPGKEVHIYYGPCEGEDDFVCRSCQVSHDVVLPDP
jgi:hypothetical protein